MNGDRTHSRAISQVGLMYVRSLIVRIVVHGPGPEVLESPG